MNADALAFATIQELGTAIRSGAVSPTELATFYLERLDTIGRSLNAVTTLTPERAMAAARKAEDELTAGVDRGPLHGIPYGAKDLLATVDYPTSWGAAPFQDQQFAIDAAVIQRLDEAGAVLCAKLSMVEIAGGFGYQQADAAFNGPGICSWSRDAWTGGSSSGSGSAVGAGCVPFAIGTETWGSIHCPSSFNGLTGLRPTYGTVSRAGAMALSWTMDKIGPMCHTAADCELVLAAICDRDEWLQSERKPGPFRIAVLADATAHTQAEVATNFAASLDHLAEFAIVEPVALAGDIPWNQAASIIVA
ncbi:MAG: amidase, partial [Thermomicrobiales bacterium]|nr:amidase [Thermomicrobiales bacterium]